MANVHPKPGYCVHCHKFTTKLTWDHILPKSWYPVMDIKLEKWVVPSCLQCNRDLGKLEERLLSKLALCLDPNERYTFGIPQKVHRSINPLFGKDEIDIQHRKAKREKLRNEIKIISKPIEANLLPGFEVIQGLEYKVYGIFEIDFLDLESFFIKIVRGIAYISNNSIIDDNYKFEVFFIDENNPEFQKDLANSIVVDWHNKLDKNGEIFERPPSFIAKRYLVENDKVGGIYNIEIWNCFNAFVIIYPKSIIIL